VHPQSENEHGATVQVVSRDDNELGIEAGNQPSPKMRGGISVENVLVAVVAFNLDEDFGRTVEYC
jgi:hypothetical protein